MNGLQFSSPNSQDVFEYRYAEMLSNGYALDYCNGIFSNISKSIPQWSQELRQALIDGVSEGAITNADLASQFNHDFQGGITEDEGRALVLSRRSNWKSTALNVIVNGTSIATSWASDSILKAMLYAHPITASIVGVVTTTKMAIYGATAYREAIMECSDLPASFVKVRDDPSIPVVLRSSAGNVGPIKDRDIALLRIRTMFKYMPRPERAKLSRRSFEQIRDVYDDLESRFGRYNPDTGTRRFETLSDIREAMSALEGDPRRSQIKRVVGKSVPLKDEIAASVAVAYAVDFAGRQIGDKVISASNHVFDTSDAIIENCELSVDKLRNRLRKKQDPTATSDVGPASSPPSI